MRKMACTLVALALGASALPRAAVAADATTRIALYETALNKYAARIGRLSFEGHFDAVVCDSDWKATVSDLTFDINGSGISFDAEVTATWCDLSLPTQRLEGTAGVAYDADRHEILLPIESAEVPIRFELLGRTFTVWSVSVDRYVQVPPIPVRPFSMAFASDVGNDALIVVPGPIAPATRTNPDRIELTCSVGIR